jgi:hypothetical protein
MLEAIWQEVVKTQRRVIELAAMLARSVATEEQLPMVERGVQRLLSALAEAEARADQRSFCFKPKGAKR